MTLPEISNIKVTLKIINIHVIRLYVATQNTIAPIITSDWNIFIKFSDDWEIKNTAMWNVFLEYSMVVKSDCSNHWDHFNLFAKPPLFSLLYGTVFLGKAWVKLLPFSSFLHPFCVRKIISTWHNEIKNYSALTVFITETRHKLVPAFLVHSDTTCVPPFPFL